MFLEHRHTFHYTKYRYSPFLFSTLCFYIVLITKAASSGKLHLNTNCLCLPGPFLWVQGTHATCFSLLNIVILFLLFTPLLYQTTITILSQTIFCNPPLLYGLIIKGSRICILPPDSPTGSNEGIDFSSYYTPREETVASLINHLHEKSILHIRGTPFSGKTALYQLLARQIAKQNVQIVCLSLAFVESLDLENLFQTNVGMKMSEFFENKKIGPRYVLVDEVQRSYDCKNANSHWLWDVAIKTMLQAGFTDSYLVLFSAYGSARQETTAGTPYTIPKDVTVLLTDQVDEKGSIIPGLLLTPTESKELFDSFVSKVGCDIGEQSKKYIYIVCGGHVGMMHASLSWICVVSPTTDLILTFALPLICFKHTSRSRLSGAEVSGGKNSSLKRNVS